jgi:hypothetical protein
VRAIAAPRETAVQAILPVILRDRILDDLHPAYKQITK